GVRVQVLVQYGKCCRVFRSLVWQHLGACSLAHELSCAKELRASNGFASGDRNERKRLELVRDRATAAGVLPCPERLAVEDLRLGHLATAAERMCQVAPGDQSKSPI